MGGRKLGGSYWIQDVCLGLQAGVDKVMDLFLPSFVQ